MILQIIFRYELHAAALLLCALQCTVSAVDWCGFECGNSHTMCKFPKDTPGSACGSDGKDTLSKKQIKDILDVHNRYRDYVAGGKEGRSMGGSMPTAANMGMMTWNDELAEVAQRWARQCNFAHDECRRIKAMSAGQNIAMYGSSDTKGANLTNMAWDWYNTEVGKFSASSIEPFESTGGTGHFTQYIWATSYQLGCGYVSFKDGGFNTYHLVCNYGPAGNMIGGQMYKKGKPCSACPKGSKCGGDARFPNLCTADDGGVPEVSSAEGAVNQPGSTGNSGGSNSDTSQAASVQINQFGMLMTIIAAAFIQW